MTAPARTPPKTHQMLSRWADGYARRIGEDVARVRRWIAYMALGGALERAGFYGDGPRFTIKGGVALELRLRARARATRDLDLIVNHPTAGLLDELDAALAARFESFSFRRHGSMRALPRDALRVEVAVQYGGKSWARIQVDLSRREADVAEFEMVPALHFPDYAFGFPEHLPCLSLYAQAAQKVHGMTRPSTTTWTNDRFKDLVDLLLLSELIEDVAAFRTTCERVFAARGTHPWPPPIEAPASWREPFRVLAEQVALSVTDVDEALFRARSFLETVESKMPPAVAVAVPTNLGAR
jgi:Nucleotidyl transferase AbiEii toxin, Type IV TA system